MSGLELAENIDGLKSQIIIVLSLVFLLWSFIGGLGAILRRNVSGLIFWFALMVTSFSVHLNETSVSCGCDFGEDPSGCESACQYDWDSEFFTTKYLNGVWEYYF